MLIICKLRNNTLRKFVGMNGDVMTTGNRKETYCGVHRKRSWRGRTCQWVPSTCQDGLTWPVHSGACLICGDMWSKLKQQHTAAWPAAPSQMAGCDSSMPVKSVSVNLRLAAFIRGRFTSEQCCLTVQSAGHPLAAGI